MEATARGGLPAPGARSRRLRDYLTLTKPKVQSLLLLTTVTTMYVAGDPSLGLVFLTCLGGALSAGGAGAINHAIDRDIDRKMSRTADRPVAAGRISPGAAIAFGALLGCPRSPCWRSPSTRSPRPSRSPGCSATSSSTRSG